MPSEHSPDNLRACTDTHTHTYSSLYAEASEYVFLSYAKRTSKCNYSIEFKQYFYRYFALDQMIDTEDTTDPIQVMSYGLQKKKTRIYVILFDSIINL